MKRLVTIAVLFLVISFQTITASPLETWQVLTVANGLSDDEVLCSMRDKYGFVWLGTANGLNRYDGAMVKVYRDFNVMPLSTNSNVVTTLAEDGKNILAGTPRGILIYHRATDTFSRFNVSTRYGVTICTTVQAIVKTSNGLLWIATLGQGLFIYNPKNHSLTQNSRLGAFITGMTQSDDGYIWLSTLQGQIMMLNVSGRLIRSFTIDGLSNNRFNITIQHSGNNIWAGTEKDLLLLNRATGKFNHFTLSSQADGINAIQPVNGNEILVGAYIGMYSFNIAQKSFTKINILTNGSFSKNVNAIMRDAAGTLWASTAEGAFYQPLHSSDFKFISLPSASSTSDEAVTTSFCNADKDNLWIGTTEGLFKYNTTKGSLSKAYGGQLPSDIQTLAADGRFLWIGTHGDGLRVLDTATGSIKSYVYSANKPYTVLSNDINSICRAANGIIYVGTSWGICHFDRATERFINYSSLDAMTPIIAISDDGHGTLWAASSNQGVFRLNKKSGLWTIFLHNNQMNTKPSASVNDIKAFADGKVYLATKGDGVCVYNSGRSSFTPVFKSSNHIQDLVVYSFCKDRGSNMWIASPEGLIKLFHSRQSAEHFNISGSNSHDDIFTPRAAYLSSSGQIFIGCKGGFYVFNPNKVDKKVKSNPIYIMSLSFTKKNGFENTDNRQAARRISLFTSKEVSLPYADNSFAIHFVSPEIGSPTKIKYEYMLKGHDEEWLITENTSAYYSELAPGTYTFLVRRSIAGSEGNVTKLTITILPPWYRSTVAIILYIIIIAFLGYIVTKQIKEATRKKYQAYLKAYNEMREKEDYQAKIKFFVGLVHEIRTPVSLISLPLERLEEEAQTDKTKKYLMLIRRNLRYLTNMTNQLLDFQKVDSGNIKPNMRMSDVTSIAKSLALHFEGNAKEEGKDFITHLPDEPISAVVDSDMVKTILMNLLVNALKYSRDKIVFSLEQTDENTFTASVSDDGNGVPDEEKDKVFDTFYQVKDDKIASDKGTGLGLALAHSLAEMQGGQLIVVDTDGGGAKFVLTMPLDNKLNDDLIEETADEISNKTKKFTVLLVEDNVDLLSMTASVMNRWYRILKAEDAFEALKTIERDDVDVIVSDVTMPGMSGNQLCAKVKTDINTSHIPVILLTAKTSLDAKIEGMQSGADAYMEKPFSTNQLHMQIENLLKMRQNFFRHMLAIADKTTEDDSNENDEYGLSQHDYEFTQHLQQQVEGHLSENDFSLETLANELNMSRSSFYRKVKALTGMSPVDYMRTARLNRAAQLIRQHQRITDVMFSTGFTSSSYFAKCFKNQFGLTPKEYSEAGS